MKRAPLVIAVAVCIALAIVLFAVMRDRRPMKSELRQRRESLANICRGQIGTLRFVISEYEEAARATPDSPIAKTLRAEATRKTRHAHLNQFIHQACVGKPIPVNTDAASSCWLERGDDGSCYVDVARQLLALYEEHVLEWVHP